MPKAQVNGVSLYYEEHGEGDAIVGIHGAGSSAALWATPAKELAKRGRTIVYDRRGHSRSDRLEPYETNVHQQADDAVCLIDALDAAPAVLIARSYGGAIALDVALRDSDRVRALILLEGDAGITLSGAATRELVEFTDAAERAAAVDMDTVGETLVRLALSDSAWEQIPEEAREIFTGNGPAILAELRGGYPDVTLEQLGSVDQPTLLVGARDSQFDYSEMINIAANAMPAAQVEWVDGGHAIDPAHPVVLEFLDGVLAPG